jgi:hypothetical protein
MLAALQALISQQAPPPPPHPPGPGAP